MPLLQTTSSVTWLLSSVTSVVPPTERTWGLDAGKSTWTAVPPSGKLPSIEPSSPAARRTVLWRFAASLSVVSMSSMTAGEKEKPPPASSCSANPQLTEMTDGWFLVSCTALVIASTQPRSVKLEK